MNLDEVLKTFIVESQQLLQEMEDALLRIEHSPQDPDIINAVFRAAHTIKGSAGLFGLDAIVSFTHVAESVLDRIRNGELPFTEELAALFLKVCDHIGVLIFRAAQGEALDKETLGRSEELAARLQTYLEPKAATDPAVSLTSQKPQTGMPTRTAATENWHLSLRFGRDVMRNGMDPMSCLRYLNTLGKIVHIVALVDSLPLSAEMDPESCYLGFELSFQSDAGQSAIEETFDFVREESRINILPPHSDLSNYKQLIAERPEEDKYLEEILIECGTLTEGELAASPAQDSEQPVAEQKITPASGQEKSEAQQARPVATENTLIRVDAAKLDNLINLIGELIISGAGVNLLARRAGLPSLIEATGDLSRLVENVRDSALNLRMVQIGATFNRFQRVVRDVSKELGKDIRLKISGAETELDKTVVERITDPLTHLVRNSMDHGIESAETRLSRGKATHGTLLLNAYHDSGSIVIEVSDDGGGLNKEKILRKAIDRGLVDEGASLTDREIYNLIFEPGFSTADQISNLSGRGVGMDVVKKNIQALRGTVDLESTPEQGSTVRIRLPLTLAIIDGFLIGVGSANYVVPLEMVVECIELPRDFEETSNGRNYLNLRGEVLPFIRLRELFEIDDEPARRQNVVVVKHAEKRVGLVVDQLLGEFQTVIKPLGQLFNHLKGISGFTILGDGEVSLILDVPGIVRQVTATSSRHLPQTTYAETNETNYEKVLESRRKN